MNVGSGGGRHLRDSGGKRLAFPHLGFVGGLLFAIRKAGRVAPSEPPEYLRCPITQAGRPRHVLYPMPRGHVVIPPAVFPDVCFPMVQTKRRHGARGGI